MTDRNKEAEQMASQFYTSKLYWNAKHTAMRCMQEWITKSISYATTANGAQPQQPSEVLVAFANMPMSRAMLLEAKVFQALHTNLEEYVEKGWQNTISQLIRGNEHVQAPLVHGWVRAWAAIVLADQPEIAQTILGHLDDELGPW